MRARTPIVRLVTLAAGVVIVLVVGVALYHHQANRSALRRLPAVPSLDGKAESLKQALAAADRKARQTPRSVEAVGMLGMLYQANHLHEQAAQCYRLAMDLSPSAAEWPYLLVMVCEASGSGEAMGDLLRTVLRLSPDDLSARVKLGDLLLKQGDLASAEQEYRRCVDQSPREVHALLGLARVAVERKRWQQAEDCLRQTVEIDPRFGAGHRLLATVYDAMGDPERAAMSRTRAQWCGRFRTMPDPWVARLDDLCYDPMYLMVRADTARGDAEKHLALLYRAIEVAPDDARPYSVLAKALRDRNNLAAALQYARRAVELDPNNEDAVNGLGFFLWRQQQLDEAEKCFRMVLRGNPESASALHGLGLVSVGRGNDLAAAADFLRACELSENRYDEAIKEYTGCLVRLKRHREATEFLRTLVKSSPSAQWLWVLLARVQGNLEGARGAIMILRESLVAAPYDPELAEILAYHLARSSETTPEEAAEAIRWASRALEMAPPDYVANCLSTLAAAHARAGDFPRAVAIAQRAVALARKNGQQDKAMEFSRALRLFESRQPLSSSQVRS